MNKFEILIVEDDEEQVNTWKKQIERYCAKNDLVINANYADTKALALDLIENHVYDIAIVDIRLKRDDNVKDATHDGNDVREEILNNELMLVAHVTGEPGASDVNNDQLVRTFIKADSEGYDLSLQERVLNWAVENSELIETIKDSKSLIKKKMAKLFSSSIWPRWERWNLGGDPDFIRSCIARHLSSHIYSEFLMSSEGKVHPEEWYFLPPNKERLHTGDVFLLDENFYILVTPRCDLERMTNSDSLLLAKMLDINADWESEKTKLTKDISELEEEISDDNTTEPRKEKLLNKIERKKSGFRKKFYGHSDGRFNLHFLPEIYFSQDHTAGPFYVDFSHLITKEFSGDNLKYMCEQKVALVASEFIPSLVQRLGSYISRIGSPDYSHVYN